MPARVAAGAVLIACLALTMGPIEGVPATADGEIHVERLANGLAVVVAVRPQVELLAVNLTVAVGSHDDPPGQAGMAHLIEHVSLTGTLRHGSTEPEAETEILASLDRAQKAWRRARRSPRAAVDSEAAGRELRHWQARALAASDPGDVYASRLEPLGGLGLNATTTGDVTQYFCRLPTEALSHWLELEADRLANPLFRGFYSERAAVQQEIRALTQGGSTLTDLLMQQLVPGQSRSWSPLGLVEEVDRIGRQDALQHFRRTYVPSRMVLTVVGNVAPERVLELARRHLSQLGAESRVPADATPGAGPPDAPLVRAHTAGARSILLFAFPAPPVPSEDAAALRVVAELLNSEPLSPLHASLVRSRKIAASVRAIPRFPGHRDPAVFLIQLLGAEHIPLRRLLADAREALYGLSSTPTELLHGAIRLTRVKRERRLADAGRLAAFLGLHQALYGDPGRVATESRALARMSPARVRQALDAYLGSLPPAVSAGQSQGGEE